MVEGIHELILQGMINNPDESRIQELALEAMAVLSTAGKSSFISFHFTLFVVCRGLAEGHRTQALVFLISRGWVRIPVMTRVSL